MFMRHKAMQRRINRGGARIEVEGAMVEQANHLILMRQTAVNALQTVVLVHIKR